MTLVTSDLMHTVTLTPIALGQLLPSLTKADTDTVLVTESDLPGIRVILPTVEYQQSREALTADLGDLSTVYGLADRCCWQSGPHQ